MKEWKSEERRVQGRVGRVGFWRSAGSVGLRTSRWPRVVNSDWGGFRRSSLVVRPRMVMYPRRMALRRVELEGEPREWETYVAKAASLRLKIGGVVGLMEKAEMSGAIVDSG